MSPATTLCRICIYQAELLPSDFDGEHRKCLHCGEYRIVGTAIGMMESYAVGDKSRVSLYGWVRYQNNQGTVPTITSETLKRVANRPLPSVAERANLLLLEIVRSQSSLSEKVDVLGANFISATYSQDDKDVFSLATMLCEQGLTRGAEGRYTNPVLVNFEGYERADELVRRPLISASAFVAMRFADELDEAYNRGISVAILNAGYEPVRVDKTEHVKRIDDEIIARIRASAFVVADFTEHSPGVYFEAGFALGRDLPVIWTCRKDHMDDLHFDIRQYNCIDWENPEELASRLQPRIEAIAGKGPKASAEDG